ncbi:MAG: hypothetical protein HZR80_02890 [Candidatus Heimdallarchaeota archaeon]
MQRRKFGLVFILLILVFLLAKQPVEVMSTNPEILSVSHVPTSVTHMSNVTVTVTFADDTNITSIQIQYCSLEPVFACHIGNYQMVKKSENTWSGSFEVLEEEGVIGYELKIQHTKGEFVAPDSTDFLGYDNIQEPSTGEFYFSINITTPTEETPVNFCWPCVALTFTTFIVLRSIKIKRRNVKI